MTQTQPRTASWQALGTSAVLRLSEAGPLAEAQALVEAELAAIDRACSRFRADSELSRLNAAAGRPFAAGPLLAEALQVALRAVELTEGDVDPSVGLALELAGYDRDWSLLDHGEPSRPLDDPARRLDDPARRLDGPALPFDGPARRLGRPPGSPSMRVRARLRPGWESIRLDRRAGVVRMPAGVKLDLGATAKAWAADRAAARVAEATGVGALVALGGDVATAGPAPSGGWRVYVTDDHCAGLSAPGQTIVIHGGGLATSSVTVRRWIRSGTEMHHIIDPATGQPAQGHWRTVSVAAADCTDANIASTAAILRSHRAPAWLASLGMPARLVAHDGGVVIVGGWPAEAEQERAAA
jgi:FAD:protein FMN transferase